MGVSASYPPVLGLGERLLDHPALVAVLGLAAHELGVPLEGGLKVKAKDPRTLAVSESPGRRWRARRGSEATRFVEIRSVEEAFAALKESDAVTPRVPRSGTRRGR